MPGHHLLEQLLNEYIEVADFQNGQPLFQSVNSAERQLTGRALNRYNAWRRFESGPRRPAFSPPWMSHLAANRHHHLPRERRAARARPTVAGHESPRTTKVYDRKEDEITLSEVERIRL
jgi:hypothetical protein